MDIDDEIELIFNDLRIDNESLKEYSISNIYATSKQTIQTTSMGEQTEFIYEIKHSEDIQDSEMEEA